MALFRQGPRPEDHFTMIANQLARDPNIPIEAKGIYLFMRSHRDGWKMTTERIGEACGVSRNRAAKYINVLIDAGYIIRTQDNEGGKFGAIEYEILAEPLHENRAPDPTSDDDVNPQVRPQTKNPHSGNLDPIRRTLQKNTKGEEAGVTAPSRTPAESATAPSPSIDPLDAIATPEPGTPEEWCTADDPRCREHAGLPGWEVPACRACGSVREWFESQVPVGGDDRARLFERDACPLCDENGIVTVGSGSGMTARKCSHGLVA